MGTICGGDGFGPFLSDIGVAPGITFIAAKGFDRRGYGSVSQLRSCLQWFAELGDDAPDIISNSWGSGRTNREHWNDIVNLNNLDIIVVFSIGNSGPEPATSMSPGSFPIVIGSGATDNLDNIWTVLLPPQGSSRGPAPNMWPWNRQIFWPRSDWNLINPAISAPGVDVRSSVPTSVDPTGYKTLTGTSMACPHVAGCIALMLQKNRNLSFNQIFNIITNNADQPSQGIPYPNNNYGWGRLNCYQALIQTPGPESYQPDNQIKNYWWSLYIGNNIYNESGQTINQLTDLNQPAVFHIKIQNDGTIVDNISVRAIELPTAGSWVIEYFDALQGGNNITSQITSSSGWMTGELIFCQSRQIRVEIAPNANVPQMTIKRITILSCSLNDTIKCDTAYINTEFWSNAVQPDLQVKRHNELLYIGNNIYNNNGLSQTSSQWLSLPRQTAMYDIKIENDGEYLSDEIIISGSRRDVLIGKSVIFSE